MSVVRLCAGIETQARRLSIKTDEVAEVARGTETAETSPGAVEKADVEAKVDKAQTATKEDKTQDTVKTDEKDGNESDESDDLEVYSATTAPGGNQLQIGTPPSATLKKPAPAPIIVDAVPKESQASPVPLTSDVAPTPSPSTTLAVATGEVTDEAEAPKPVVDDATGESSPTA